MINYNDIKNLWLSVESSDFFTEDWSGTVLDVLNMENLPNSDKLWIVINDKFISTEILEKFTDFCSKDSEYINMKGVKGSVYRARYALWSATWKKVNYEKEQARKLDNDYGFVQRSGTYMLDIVGRSMVKHLKELLDD